MSLVPQKRLVDLAPRRKPLRKHGNESAWQKDLTGHWQVPENQSEFLDWLLTLEEDRPQGEKNEAGWAKEHGVAESTVKRWKQNDRFRLEWSKRAAAKNISVERLQNILDMLYRRAIVANDTNAATRWLAWVEKYMPPVKVQTDEEAAHLSDEELAAEMRELLEDDDWTDS